MCRCPPLSERAATTQPNPTQPNPIQAMEDGTLAIMVPLMVRALRERSTVVNRRASVIIENMCKLVRGCRKFACLLPSLLVKLTAMDWNQAGYAVACLGGMLPSLWSSGKWAAGRLETQAGLPARISQRRVQDSAEGGPYLPHLPHPI